MKQNPSPEEAEEFVKKRVMSLQEIKMVRGVLKVSRFLPGSNKMLTPEVRKEVLRILEEKEKELRSK